MPNGTSATELSAALDAHDALVRECAEGRLTFREFLGAYGDFPRGYGCEKDSISPEEHDALRFFRKRVAFHRQVAGLMSGLGGISDLESREEGGAGDFLPVVALRRLRELVARHPDFEVTGGGHRRSAALLSPLEQKPMGTESVVRDGRDRKKAI